MDQHFLKIYSRIGNTAGGGGEGEQGFRKKPKKKTIGREILGQKKYPDWIVFYRLFNNSSLQRYKGERNAEPKKVKFIIQV
jgi:hypothetical protein